MSYEQEPIIITMDGWYILTSKVRYIGDGVDFIINRGMKTDGITTNWLTRFFFTE